VCKLLDLIVYQQYGIVILFVLSLEVLPKGRCYAKGYSIELLLPMPPNFMQSRVGKLFLLV
jgi:hypothetical protein